MHNMRSITMVSMLARFELLEVVGAIVVAPEVGGQAGVVANSLAMLEIGSSVGDGEPVADVVVEGERGKREVSASI